MLRKQDNSSCIQTATGDTRKAVQAIKSSSHIYNCLCMIYLNLYLSSIIDIIIFYGWLVTRLSIDQCYCIFPDRQSLASTLSRAQNWTHLTKSILLLMAAQWRSVTFSLSGCRTSKPASTNSLQRSKMPYLRKRGNTGLNMHRAS